MDEKEKIGKYIQSLSEIVLMMAETIKEESPDIIDEKLMEELSLRFDQEIDSSFLCGANSDIVDFLKNDAINYEINHFSRTFFVCNDNAQWMGMFVLGLKDLDLSGLSTSKKKKYLARHKVRAAKYIDAIPAILIGQFAKNDLATESGFSGSELMSWCLSTIEEIRSWIGGKVVILDSVDNERVIDFYKMYGFHEIGKKVVNKRTGVLLQPMVLSFEKQF